MKTMKTVIALLAGFCQIAVANTANEGGNGGDPRADRFVAVMERTLRTLDMLCGTKKDLSENVQCEDLQDLRDAFSRTKVSPGEHLKNKSGQSRQAINNGKDTIEVDFSEWNSRGFIDPDMARDLVAIVLHEYACVADLETGDQYHKSVAMLNLMIENNVNFYTLLGAPAKDSGKNLRYFSGESPTAISVVDHYNTTQREIAACMDRALKNAIHIAKLNAVKAGANLNNCVVDSIAPGSFGASQRGWNPPQLNCITAVIIVCND